MELLYWILGAIVFVFGTTYLLKRTGKAQTYYFVSLLKTRRFVSLLDRFTRHKRFLNWFADLGLILGFGAIAIDYRYGRGKGPAKRVALFLVSSTILYFVLDYILVLDILSENSPLAAFNQVIRISFALFGLSGLILSFLAAYSMYIVQGLIAGRQVCPGVAPIIPGLEIPKLKWVVPLHAWISFVAIMVLHEGMHGILMRKVKTKIKSVGLVLIGLLPVGAFVEPDEKELKAKKPVDQLRAYVAGPASNLYASIAVSVLLSLFIVLVFLPAFGPWIKEVRESSVTGVLIGNVEENIDLCGELYRNDAFGKLEPGMRVMKINDQNIVRLEDIFALGNFGTALGEPNTIAYASKHAPIKMELLTENGQPYSTEIFPNELGLIRFGIEEEKNPNYKVPESYTAFASTYSLLRDFLFWFILLNFFVAIANLLPTEPFDGGKVVKIILLPYFGFLGMSKKDTEKFIGRLFVWIVGALLLINVLPMFL